MRKTKGKKNEWKLLGQNNNKKKGGKKGNYHPIKDSVVTDIMGAIKVESSTITAAAGSLQRGSDNGPEGKRQRAQGPGIVRKTDKKTQEQVISQFMRCHSTQTLTCSAGKTRESQAGVLLIHAGISLLWTTLL